MSEDEEKFFEKLEQTYSEEAQENAAAISTLLLDLENGETGMDRQAALEEVFQRVHTLKGASWSVNRHDIARLCSGIEACLKAFEKGEFESGTEFFFTVHEAVDTIQNLIFGEGSAVEGDEAYAALNILLGKEEAAEVGALRLTSKKGGRVPVHQEGSFERKKQDFLKLSTVKLNRVMLQVEEMLGVKLAVEQRLQEVRELERIILQWNQEKKRAWFSMKDSLLKTMTLEEFFGLVDTYFREMEGRVRHLKVSADRDFRNVGSMVDHLLGDMKSILMQPFFTFFSELPRLVRDVCHPLGKRARMHLNGEDIELDRRVLLELKKPIMYLVQNCVEHGIEAPEVRREREKSEIGAIAISLERISGNLVEISLTDDGAGIDVPQLRAAALEAGIVHPAEMDRLSAEDACNLVFDSPLWGQRPFKRVGGPGRGMKALKGALERLGGQVHVESAEGKGCTFRMRVPISRATFRGIHVRSVGRDYVVPSLSVDHVVRFSKQAVFFVEGLPTVMHKEMSIPLIDLSDVLQISRGSAGRPKEEGTYFFALVMRSGNSRLAFKIDEVVREQELLIKTVGQSIKSMKFVSGFTTLGSGLLVPILDTSELLQGVATYQGKHGESQRPGGSASSSLGKATVLLVDDSISSRSLLRSAFEEQGFHIKTSPNGRDAMALLDRLEALDIVLCDVDASQVDGFALAEAVRSHQRWANIPVVLFSEVPSTAHQERSKEAGADAYICKEDYNPGRFVELIQTMVS